MDSGIEVDVTAVLNHVHALEKTLMCSNCNGILKDPVIIGRCGHTFCQSCVAKYAGKQCPTCKVPVDIKDSHEDKQLCDLLQAVVQLKLLLNDEDNAESKRENGPVTNVEGSAEICKTPLCTRSSTKEITVATELVSRAQRMRKRTKCRATDCHCSPKGCLTPKKSQTFTPVNTAIRRTAMSSPIVRRVKRPSFRFSAFSASKSFSSKLKSPRQNALLSSLSNVEKKNAKGETALHVAVIKGDVDRVKLLLMKKANPNVKDNAGWTPLHEASNHGYFRIAELLVRHGAEVNVVGPENITPLHDAVMNGRAEVAKLLASVGADINAKTVDGYSAIELCQAETLKSTLRKSYSEWKKSKTEVKTSNVDKKISPEVSVVIENLKVVLLPSCLIEASKQILQKCANDVLQGEVVTDFTPTVTHIITCLEDGQCIRTLKILCGILLGKWILDFKWIDACLKYEKRVPEEEFEAAGTRQLPNTQGPKRARLNAMQKFPPLFHGCHFYTYGTFSSPSPSKTEINQLIQMGGGKVLAREPKPETVNQEKFVAPYHTTNGILSDISYFILYQEKPPRQTAICGNHICTVSIDWFINSICSFELLEPSF